MTAGPAECRVRPTLGSRGPARGRAGQPLRHERRPASLRHVRPSERSTARVEPTWIGRLWSRLLEVEFVDRSVALAAKAFVSFLPGIILIAALSPESVRQRIVENLGIRFGISDDAFETVRHAFASAAQTRAAAGIFGTILTIAFMVSFITALQRTFLRAWRRPPGGGARNKGRAFFWLAGVLALMLLISLARGLIAGGAGRALPGRWRWPALSGCGGGPPG